MQLETPKGILIEQLANKKVARKWIVIELRYDYDWNSWSVIKLPKPVEYASPFCAVNYANILYNQYMKKLNNPSDLKIVIKEVAIDKII